MKKPILLLLVFGAICAYNPCHAQLLKKLKDKVNKTVNPSTTSTDNSSSTDANATSADAGGKPVNKGGGGLKNTLPPDVNQQMSDAEQAQAAANYSDARYSIQQALIGIEIQLGRELLKSLPDPVDGLAKDTTQDKVVSTQWGWNNMTIQRVYTDKKDKQLTVTIGNNAMYAGIANIYFNNTSNWSYGGAPTNGEQNTYLYFPASATRHNRFGGAAAKWTEAKAHAPPKKPTSIPGRRPSISRFISS